MNPQSAADEPALQLTAVPISREAFAPYGWLASAAGCRTRPINDGSAQRADGMGELALTAAGGDPCLALFRARAQAPQGPWRVLERHALGTQTFVPLAGTRCVLLVALGRHAPDMATLAAFAVAGDQAFTLATGTWHHGLIALDDGDFVVIERRAAVVDCDLAPLPRPVQIRLG